MIREDLVSKHVKRFRTITIRYLCRYKFLDGVDFEFCDEWYFVAKAFVCVLVLVILGKTFDSLVLC